MMKAQTLFLLAFVVCAATAKTVAVFGSGPAGLTVAHELAERGFDVTVYERQTLFGGKARSINVTGTGTDGRPDLPGEHGFRFFAGFYQHLPDTLSRIPGRNGGTVKDHLVAGDVLGMFSEFHPVGLIPSHPPGSVSGFFDYLRKVFSFMSVVDIPKNEFEFFMNRMFVLLTSCDDRWNTEYENMTYWKYMQPEKLSRDTVRYLVQSTTRFLLACKAEKASLRSVGRTFLRLMYDMFKPGYEMDHLLDGPTSWVWIDPMVKHLSENLNVKFNNRQQLEQFVLNTNDRKTIAKAIVRNLDTNTDYEVIADYYVSAIPAEKMAIVMSKNDDMMQAAPSLSNLDKLDVEWMNGIQFFLKDDAPIVHGHMGFMDSPWALTAISQPQFWSKFDVTKMGDGNVKGILSVDISDFNAAGDVDGPSQGKPAKNCTREQIKDEVWHQLRKHKGMDQYLAADQSNLVHWFLDTDITFDTESNGLTNLEPLLINTMNSLPNRPNAFTELPNLFVAADYVRTTTDLACMEAAAEAGRRAVNALLVVEGRSDFAKVFDEIWPQEFNVLKKIDCKRFKEGKEPLGWNAQP